MSSRTIIEAHRGQSGRVWVVLNRGVVLVQIDYEEVFAITLGALDRGIGTCTLGQEISDCGTRPISLGLGRLAVATHLSRWRRPAGRWPGRGILSPGDIHNQQLTPGEGCRCLTIQHAARQYRTVQKVA